jgi:hypothetical protein
LERDPLFEAIAVGISLGLFVIAGRLLGAGSEAMIEELFPRTRTLEWPRGVQEEDMPRFVFSNAA